MKRKNVFRVDSAMGRGAEQMLHAKIAEFHPDAVLCQPRPYSYDGYNPDSGDIQINAPIQVKRRLNLTFTCEQDYPFPTLFVDEEYQTCPKDPRTNKFVYPLLDWYAMPEQEKLLRMRWFHAYILCNTELTHAAVVFPISKPQWTLTERRWLHEEQRHGRFWQVPKSWAFFTPLDDIRSILTRL